MSLLTPSGKSNFDWTSLGNKFTKTASTGSKRSSREEMYAIAERFAKQAQLEDEGSEFGVNSVSETEPAPTDSDVGLEMAAPAEVSEKKTTGGDAVSAVQDLVSKVEKAEEITQKVQDALSKVDDAVKDVKDAVGLVGEKEGEEVDEVEIEITDDEGEEGEADEIEIEIEDDVKDVSEKSNEFGAEVEDSGEDSDKLVKESKEKGKDKEDCDKSVEKCASKEVGDFVKLSSINNNTRKQIKEYWEKLGMPKDFVALMVKDYEK